MNEIEKLKRLILKWVENLDIADKQYGDDNKDFRDGKRQAYENVLEQIYLNKTEVQNDT